jgi:transcriptional regulator with XRE-family HTH domain
LVLNRNGAPLYDRTPAGRLAGYHLVEEVCVARQNGNGGEPEYVEMGNLLRAARRAHGLSLRALADLLKISPSLISQVETGRAKPSVNTLYAMATELDMSLDDLLFTDDRPPTRGRRARAGAVEPVPAQPVPPGAPPAPVQRAADRKVIRLASGVVWERLTTVSTPNAEFIHVTYEVGGASSPEHEFQRHNGQEWGYIISGTLGVTVGFDEYVLGPGDAISLDSTVPHRLYNLGTEPVHGIWFTLGRRPIELDGSALRHPGAAGP